jgi:hypothetical protein
MIRHRPKRIGCGTQAKDCNLDRVAAGLEIKISIIFDLQPKLQTLR